MTVDTQKLTRFFGEMIRSDRMQTVRKSTYSVDDPVSVIYLSTERPFPDCSNVCNDPLRIMRAKRAHSLY